MARLAVYKTVTWERCTWYSATDNRDCHNACKADVSYPSPHRRAWERTKALVRRRSTCSRSGKYSRHWAHYSNRACFNSYRSASTYLVQVVCCMVGINAQSQLQWRQGMAGTDLKDGRSTYPSSLGQGHDLIIAIGPTATRCTPMGNWNAGSQTG